MFKSKKVISLILAGTLLLSASTALTAGAEGSVSIDSTSGGSVTIDDQTSAVIAYRFPMSIDQKTDELISFGIIEGDPDGNLRLEDTLTRAEFAKIACLMHGLKGNMSQESLFDDVPSDHWASGYITTAKKMGIINGHGDGTFKPEDNVTYQEILKMLVASLGYTPMADARGGYPAGYIIVANQLGFSIGSFDDVGLDATRELTFDAVHYALDVPLMQQTGFGETVEYAIMNGQDELAYVTLRTSLIDTDEPVYTELTNEGKESFVGENAELIKDDIQRYWNRMNYEGEYTYEILTVQMNEDKSDIKVKAAIMDEAEKRYINIELNYKMTSGQIK